MQNVIDIITEDERKLVEQTPEGGFITQFVDWAAKRTDAPGYALESAALMALSMAAGDTVVLPGIFSDKPVYMNLYILIVGPSTTMRKTTVLNYVMDLLPKNQQTHQRYIQVIDDTSPQAFNKAAANAGKEMSPLILNMDEVAGVFQVSRRKNSYGAGFEKVLLSVYDHTPVTINRTGGDIEAPRGAFVNVFAASTPEPLMEVLNDDDVESGLLPRFIIFDARDAARGERIPLWKRMEVAEEWEAEKEELAAFLLDIAKSRAYGVPIGTTPEGLVNFKVDTMDVDLDAMKRLDEIDLLFHGDFINDSSGIAAIKGRALWQTYKLAGLYALSRQGVEGKVEVIDVLRAAHMIEAVAADLFRLSEEIGGNEDERNIRKVLDMLDATANRAQRQDIIANRLQLSGTATMDLIRTMTIRGLIKVEDKNGERYWRKT